jgi:hypothetical protein
MKALDSLSIFIKLSSMAEWVQEKRRFSTGVIMAIEEHSRAGSCNILNWMYPRTSRFVNIRDI